MNKNKLKLPNFFIVGAPKAGTTSLYYYLKEHPQIFMSNPKEVNFFSYEEIEKQNLYYNDFKVKNLQDYIKLFSSVDTEKAIGEASVSYLFYPHVPKKIKKLIPNAKIIIVLRNPTERAFSHYLMDLRLGYVNISFEDIIYKKISHKYLNMYYQQYVELGFYYNQVKRYFATFGRENVKIYLQEDLKNDINQVLLDLYHFLEVSPEIIPNIEKEYNVWILPKNKIIQKLYSSTNIRRFLKKILPKSLKDIVKNKLFEKDKKPKLSNKTRKYMYNFYRNDIKKLEKLLQRNLSHWYRC